MCCILENLEVKFVKYWLKDFFVYVYVCLICNLNYLDGKRSFFLYLFVIINIKKSDVK